MTADDLADEDVAGAKRELRERYREETGHELPEHVVENIDLLAPLSPSDWAEMEQRAQLAAEDHGNPDVSAPEWLWFFGMSAASGLVGVYGSRVFTGWVAQAIGGLCIAVLTFAMLGLGTWLWTGRRGD